MDLKKNSKNMPFGMQPIIIEDQLAVFKCSHTDSYTSGNSTCQGWPADADAVL
jgi:hypothetical protein